MAQQIEILYDDHRRVATATIRGTEVRFHGTREGAEKYYRGLAERMDSRGLVRVDVADVTVHGDQ